MVQDMRVSGMNKPTKEMEEDIKSGLMEAFMKDIGKMIKLMAEADSFMLTGMCTRENGKMTRLMGMENTCTPMVPNTKVIGKKINNTEKEKKHGLMVLAMKVTTLMERKMVMVNSSGLMVQPTKDNSRITTFMEEESIFGLIIDAMKDSGKITKCTAKVSSHGLMEESMKETIMMTRNKEEEFSHGQMAENTMVNGIMVNNMVRASTTLQKEKLREESGKKARELDGSLMIEVIFATQLLINIESLKTYLYILFLQLNNEWPQQANQVNHPLPRETLVTITHN